MSRPPLDFDKLVRRIVLDTSLLRWFAENGGRRDAVLSAISLARQGAVGREPELLNFLRTYCNGGGNG